MNAANVITILRIILVPIFLVILLTEMENKEIFAVIVFIIAAISDALDGYIARKYDQVTELGKFLDPLADKLLIAGALLALVHLGKVETWVATVIILREIFITGFRFYFLVKDSMFSASWLAKKKTTFQLVSVSLIILSEKLPYREIVFQAATILLYMAVILTIYSGVEYVLKYSNALKEE
ncbi:MAG: CDP-diacylglycerol--glycerol-3-phosphate 3-phosphatidyltransferase [Candidatus Aminicenantes bacterium]|nr:CDP-diacylglycerol--glycerol-3-phosphate 3-phosphatidyltransferase [Candidatus Aminicenantes bacterium]